MSTTTFHKPSRRMRVIVNAIPIINVSTGIGRYIRSLYTAMEQLYGDSVEVGYFTGKETVSAIPPKAPSITRWSRRVALLWKLPPHLGYGIRLFMHLRREYRFRAARQGADLYHEASFFPFASGNVPVVFTIHDLSLLNHPHWHPKERILFFKTFYHRRLAKVRRFIAVSQFTQLEMLRDLAIPESSITVTPEAHTPEVFYQRSEAAVTSVREKYALPESYFLFVGSGDPRKNVEIIPKALAAGRTSAPLVSVGWSGWDKDSHDSGRCRPLGFVADADLSAIYSGALALVFPSIYEGFGLPILEAMACGCPVLTTTKASLPEVAGDAALYLQNPDDPSELAALLERIEQDGVLRRQMRQKGLERAAAFSWERTAELTKQAFDAALVK